MNSSSEFTTKIKFSWDDNNKRLTIHDRSGEYPEMIEEHTFNLVLYKKFVQLHVWNEIDIEAGLKLTENPDKTVKYIGEKIVAEF